MQNNDLISRSALLEDINFDRRAAKVHPREICERFERFCDYAEEVVKEALAVDAEVVRHGRWVHKGSYIDDDFDRVFEYSCSICGRCIQVYDDISQYPYCHCGCKMDAEVQDGTK